MLPLGLNNSMSGRRYVLTKYIFLILLFFMENGNIPGFERVNMILNLGKLKIAEKWFIELC